MARIKVDVDRVIGSVDPRVFGGFIEHLGRCVHGGVLDEDSPRSDGRGFRRDLEPSWLSDKRLERHQE